MKPALQKLYDGLPDHALSMVAMNAVLRNNDREMLSAGEAIGKKDINTRRELARVNLERLAVILAWEVDFWHMAQKYTSLFALIAAGVYQEEGPEKVIASELMRRVLESTLASMLEAMRQWCAETGFEFDVVAAIEIRDFPMIDEFHAEQVHIDEALAVLRQVTRH